MTQSPDPARADDGAGVVYVMTNAAEQNAIVTYQRAPDGRLTERGRYATGGRGSGVGVTVPPDPLGSQDALLLREPWLFAVNAGSNEVSVFRTAGDRLTLRDTVASGGRYPVSLTFHAPWWGGVVFGAALAVSATIGDLGESLIKRDLGLKDMGHLLPGHGGIMDRLDSLLPSAALAYLLLNWLVPA